MISWIQRTFQHHFRLIFAVLLIGMVIPFIFTIGSTPGIGRPDRTTASRDFFGHNLNSDEQKRVLQGDASMSAELLYGSNVNREQLDNYMYQRIAFQHLADELHMPAPSMTEIADFIKSLRIFTGADGQFDAAHYEAFRNSLKGGAEGDIARVIADDVRMNKLERLLAGPGYVMPDDVKGVLVKGDTTWSILTATVDYASFSPDISLTDAQLAKYYTENSFRYTVAPRAVVDYVRFPSDQFIPAARPSDAAVREYYDANPSLFPNPANPKAPSVKADPAADFAAVQPRVRLALTLELAGQGAVKAASDLAYAMYTAKVTRASVDSFLAGRKLKVESLPPFTSEAGPAVLGGSREVVKAAFELNSDRFYSEGIAIPAGAVVLIWRDLQPSRQPLLAEVRDKVRDDAVDNQKRARFVEFGRALKVGIERRLKAGESFDKAAAEAAAPVKVVVKPYPPFKLLEQPRDIDPAAMAALEGLGKGGVSDMEAGADKGVLVYAADRKAPDTNESNPRYQQVKAQLAAAFARTDATSAMREIVEQELSRSKIQEK